MATKIEVIPAINNLYRSQRLGLKYFAASMVLLAIVVVAGMAAATAYLNPTFLFPQLPFSMTKILHIDTMILWLLLAFIGSIYWLLPSEFDSELVGIRVSEILFWVLCAAIAIVAVVFIVVQHGFANQFSLWFINQGRKYVEAPRWAALGIVAVLLAFAWNIVGTAITTRRVTGITWVLMADIFPLFAMYLIAFPAITNASMDQFWWWWLVHFWVEATWEVFIGCILALSLLQLLGTRRAIVETWLYIEVALVLATGVLGIGHHYFWIGAPKYWMGIGGLFSALEPLPLLGMVVHAIYDAGEHHMTTTNRPAYFWLLAEAFGNFIGAGIWGFMITLPQINLFAHGTQWTVSHGHFAFWGAYGCGVIAVMYLALQQSRGASAWSGNAWKWAFALMNAGVIGMAGSLMLSGMAQSFYERAIGGSTFNAYVLAQSNPWFIEGMYTRFAFGLVFAAGFIVLAWDYLTFARRAIALHAATKPLPTTT
jgi:nitric oxide reductase subunit B